MSPKEYRPGTVFPVAILRTFQESEPAWSEPLRVKEGAPGVLFIVSDGRGYRQLGCTANASGKMIQETEEEDKAFAKAAMARQ